MYSFYISYRDTDAAGVMYYANYLAFAEKARCLWLLDNNVDVAKLHFEKNIVFPVREVNIIYKKSLYLGEKIWITVEIEKVEKYSLLVKQNFINSKGELSATGKFKIVCLENGKLCPIGKYLIFFQDDKKNK